MVEVDGETYHTASDAIRYLRVSRWKFYTSVRNLLNWHEVGTYKRPHCKQSELVALQQVRPLEKKG